MVGKVCVYLGNKPCQEKGACLKCRILLDAWAKELGISAGEVLVLVSGAKRCRKEV